MFRTNLIPSLGQLSLLRDDAFFPIQQTFDNLFQEFFGNRGFDCTKGKNGYPKMEVGIEGDCWVIRAAMPGVPEDNIVVECDESDSRPLVRIQGQMADEYQSPEHVSQYYIRELRKTKFSREVFLPKGLVGEPTAVFKDGLLTLKWQLPKPALEDTSSKLKKITIKRE